MASTNVTNGKVTVEFSGDWSSVLERIDRQLEVARPLLDRWDELSNHQQRKFEKVDARHAPFLLRLLPSEKVVVAPPRVVTRPRERRAVGAGRTRSASGDSDPPKPDLEKARILLAWSRSLEPRPQERAWIEANPEQAARARTEVDRAVKRFRGAA